MHRQFRATGGAKVNCRTSTPTTGWDPLKSGMPFGPRSRSTGGRKTQ
jgi:hypothetical protein